LQYSETVNKLQLPNNDSLDFAYYTKVINNSVLNFVFKPISQTNNHVEENLLDAFSIFHTSVPNIKLYYPEPFIATPSFIHDDIWFLHIVIYQYWLWFFFIYIIIFFFLVFLITLRWCNIRHRPVRETRGVSRSKCGDLITATVPVSWATSIIIHESTDAIEFNDGFGSTEMAVGIRAYQWGWEYYYPKDLNLMLKGSELSFLGNSLKTDLTLGKTSDYFSWKTNAKTSDFNNYSTNSGFNQLLSLKTPATSNTYSNFNFGGNKLIARKATNLITSNKVLTLDNLYFNDLTLVDGISDFKNKYLLHAFSTDFPTKPQFVNHQVSFFSSLSNFQNALNFLNINDLKLIYSQTTTSPGLFQTNLINDVYVKDTFQNSFFSTIIPLSTSALTPLNSLNILDFKTTTQLKYFDLMNSFYKITNSSTLPFALISDQDFKRWSANELLEDIWWADNLNYPTNSYYFDESIGTRKQLNCLLTNRFDFLNVSQNSFFKDLTLGELDYGFVTSLDQHKLNFLNAGETYLQNLSLLNWFNASLEYNFSSYKINSLLNTTSGFNLVMTLNSKIFKLSNLDLLLNYALQNLNYFVNYKQTPTYYQNSLVDTTSMAKSLNTYYGAFWKVFKSTIEEERSSFFFKNYSNLDFKLPIVMQKVPALLNSLQKNTTGNFFDLLAIQKFDKITSFKTLPNVWSVFTFDFPFSLGFESDIIRYSWFDWYSVRSSVVTKSMDTSVFNLHGIKDYDYSFTNNGDMQLTNRTDNFFLKYLSFKFYNSNSFSVFLKKNPTVGLKFTKPMSTFTDLTSTTRPSTKIFIGSLNIAQNQTDTFTNILDILTKKEYIIKSISMDNFQIETNKKYLVNSQPSLNNPIVLTLKTIYNSSDFGSKKTINTNKIFFQNYKKPLLGLENKNDTMLLKSQYQPLRKGIVNLIRIQADKAVAMPTDTRLQILAVSKDIIHSWAIPSAGIKIDCIPGYSSHRVAIFTLSGIYWGQCMEICGRFHHWMPIVVYFIRRDLFCLWCIHFVFKSNQTNSTLQALDWDYSDSTSQLSQDTNTWAYELN